MDKHWKDCPVCGARSSMRVEKGRIERFNPAGYPPVEVNELDGQFCEECGDGFWSAKSERRITQRLAEHMADYDGRRIVAAELASVKEAAESLQVTVQGVHKMMKEGRLRYVVAGGARLPIRSELKAVARSRIHTIV